MRTQNLTICLGGWDIKNASRFSLGETMLHEMMTVFPGGEEQGHRHLFPNHSDCSGSFTSFIVKRLLHIEEHISLRTSDSMLINSGYPCIITSVPLIV